MQLEIRFVSTDSSAAVSAHVERHVGYALGRFYTRIARLTVRFEDENGPRGGLDKVCRIEATGDFGKRIAEVRGADLYVTSARALDVLERSVARAMRRQRAELRAPSELERRRRSP